MNWLAGKLTMLMQARNETVETVARQLGIERSRLANVIAGSAIPNENLTKRFAKFFGEDPDEWLKHLQKREDPKPVTNVPHGFVKVANVREIAIGGMKIVLNNLAVVANVGGQFHAFGNMCPHAGGPLGEGFLEECVIECPWHAATWDIATGNALSGLATVDIPLFEVRVVDEDVEIRLNRVVLTDSAVSSGTR